MTLTKKQIEEMHEAAKPLIKFICDNCHPHVYIVVEPTGAELLEGVCVIKNEDYLRD